MERKDLMRGLLLAGICLGVLVYNWGFLAWPMHRIMALLMMAAVFSFAWFYELTMRDAPMGRVLAGVLAITGGAVVLWGALTLVHPSAAQRFSTAAFRPARHWRRKVASRRPAH